MNIFDIHSNITGDNEEYVRSFVNISDERVSVCGFEDAGKTLIIYGPKQ